jgi:transcriptional regulator with XRE-family HTH domain
MTVDGDDQSVRGHPTGRNGRGRRGAAADGDSPAVQGRRLRTALKDARQQAELTLDQVAAELGVSPSKIVRMESGDVQISVPDLRSMLDLYKITDPRKVAEFDSMARAAKTPRAPQLRPWWRQYRDVASQRYLQYVQLEQAGTAAMHFQPQFIPGLLQTRDYASALIRQLGREVTEERANRLLELRMERQQKLLDQPEPPTLSFVVDESAVYRQVVSAEAMEEQIRHLIKMAGRPNITIQIFRFSARPLPGMQTPFVIIQFSDPADSDALFLESPRSDTVVAKDQDEVGRYRHAFEGLQQASLPGPESVKFLDGLVHDRR